MKVIFSVSYKGEYVPNRCANADKFVHIKGFASLAEAREFASSVDAKKNFDNIGRVYEF